MKKEVQEKISRLQVMQQKLNSLILQKQNFQSQLFEIENALIEMKDATNVFKISGQVMVSSKKDILEKELNDKKKLLEARSTSFDKEEERIRLEFEKLQREVIESIDDGSKKSSHRDN